jgi:hypothetical protein
VNYGTTISWVDCGYDLRLRCDVGECKQRIEYFL